MYFTANIHTGGHTPLSLQSQSNQTIFRPERDWSVNASVNIEDSPVMVLQGLSEGVLLVRSVCHVVYFMKMNKAQEKLELQRTMNGAKNVNAQGFDSTVTGATL